MTKRKLQQEEGRLRLAKQHVIDVQKALDKQQKELDGAEALYELCVEVECFAHSKLCRRRGLWVLPGLLGKAAMFTDLSGLIMTLAEQTSDAELDVEYEEEALKNIQKDLDEACDTLDYNHKEVADAKAEYAEVLKSRKQKAKKAAKRKKQMLRSQFNGQSKLTIPYKCRSCWWREGNCCFNEEFAFTSFDEKGFVEGELIEEATIEKCRDNMYLKSE